MAVTGPILAYVEGIGHAGEGNILDNHFGKKFEGMGFKRIVFQMPPSLLIARLSSA